MGVLIANFGRGNALWPLCLESGCIAAYEDADIWPAWEAGDRDAYIEHAIAHKRTSGGGVPPRGLASRWFNVTLIVSQSNGDLWVHREKGDVWWTTSLPEEPTTRRMVAPWREAASPEIYVVSKPCEPWRNTDRKGGRLLWDGLHAKARDFLSTEATLQALSDDYADYARALVDGDPLEPWHRLPTWKQAADRAGHGSVTTFDARQKAIERMARTAEDTAKASMGPPVMEVRKRKEVRLTPAELRATIDAIVTEQEGLCAISGLRLQFDGDYTDPELLCSLDRIDSAKHYERGNLQVVCRFVNRWKGADEDELFRRLLELLRSAE